MTLVKMLATTAITTTSIIATSSIALAQNQSPLLDEMIVTAQKKSESVRRANSKFQYSAGSYRG